VGGASQTEPAAHRRVKVTLERARLGQPPRPECHDLRYAAHNCWVVARLSFAAVASTRSTETAGLTNLRPSQRPRRRRPPLPGRAFEAPKRKPRSRAGSGGDEGEVVRAVSSWPLWREMMWPAGSYQTIVRAAYRSGRTAAAML